MATQYVDIPSGGSGSGVSSLNGLTGALTLVAGSGITITPGAGTLTIASTGSSGANTALSNLITTSINQDLIFNTGAIANIHTVNTVGATASRGITFESGGTVNGASGPVTLASGAASGTGSSGIVTITSGVSTNGSTGNLALSTPNSAGSNASGDINVIAGSSLSTGGGGNVQLIAGNSAAGGTPGSINIQTGTVPGVGSNTPEITLTTDGAVVIGNISGLTSTPLQFFDSGDANSVSIAAPTTLSNTYSLSLPLDQGTGALTNNGSGSLSWVPASASGITALTGDGTATGPGSAVLTLATVNGNVGSFGTASSVSTFTVNGKGLITAASNTSIQIAESQVTNLVSDLAGKQPTGNYITALTGDVTATGPGSVAATLATVNGNVGSFGSSTSIPSFTVNAKGLITAASGNVVIAPAGTLTGTTLASNVVTSSLTQVSTSLGVGLSPAANVVLDVIADTSAATQVEQLTGYGANNIGIRIRHARGTVGTPTALLSGDPLGFIGARGYGTSQFAAANTGSIQFAATENFTNTANGTSIVFNTTPNGSVTLAQSMLLTSTALTLAGTTPLVLTGSTSGTVTLKAAATTTNYTVTMPSAQGGVSTVAVNDGAGNLTWTTFPSPYLVSSINSNTSGVSGTTYLVDTSGGAVTITLPAPVSGAFIIIKDKTGSFQTNNLTIAQHASEQIEGVAASKLLQTNWGSWSVFSDGTNWYMGPF